MKKNYSKSTLLFLISEAKYFMLYGVWYVLALMPLLAGFLYNLGFFSAFYNNILYSRSSSITFIAGYMLFFFTIAYLRSSYIVRNYQYIFTNNELIMPMKTDFFTRQKTIDYKDISNVNIAYLGFNLYNVNFTASINKKVFGKKNEYRALPYAVSLPGLSKENADQISLLIS